MLTFTQKPKWLQKKINLRECAKVQTVLGDLGLNTVCQQAQCPNISECFAKAHATFLILGKICTRQCTFCATIKGTPYPLDPQEAHRIAKAAQSLGLKHVVVTSVTRDDLSDGGAFAFAQTISALRQNIPQANIEVLIPDFQGNSTSLKIVTLAHPHIIGHNIEVVPRLYDELRKGAGYQRSLTVLKTIKDYTLEIYTKSGIMLGLGETEEEVESVFRDLRNVGCDFLSIGQYLAPSSNHYPVKRFLTPDEFAQHKEKALQYGFRHVESGPYVRSSYCASDYLK